MKDCEIIDCGDGCLALPFLPVRAACESAKTIMVRGVRPRPGLRVTGCQVAMVNADGVSMTKDAVASDGVWTATFPASHFAHFGTVKMGVRVYAVGKDETNADRTWMLRYGDLVVEAVDATAQPGSGTSGRPQDVYLKSYVDGDGVQHYVKQTMELDPEIGWGANWGGDYIYSNGGMTPFVATEA